MSSWLLMGLPGVAYLSGLAEASWTAIGLAVGTYLKWLRTTCIADELGASAFPHGAYDELRRELDRRNLAPLGDVFEIELSLYSGDWTETVYTEVSVRVG